MSDWSCPKCNLRSGQTCSDRDCPGLAKAVGQAFRTQRSSGPRPTPGLEDAFTALRAENDLLREALVYIGEVCIRHDQGNETGRVLGYIADNARAALEVKP
jgi:hypothetical protein